MSKIKIPLEILGNIDFANTMNGGRTKAELSVDRHDDHYSVIVSYPGVSPDSLEVDVENGHLWVYVLHPVLQGSIDVESFLPFTIGDLLIPSDVNEDAIFANWYTPDKKWKITLPIK